MPETLEEAGRKTAPDWMTVENPQIRSDHFAEDRAKLHPDLRPYLRRDGLLGPVLKHPLHQQVFGVLWALANEVFEYKTKALDKALDKRDWRTAVFLHERPWRIDILDQWVTAGDLTRDELRAVLPGVWTDAEYPTQHGRAPIRLFKAAGFVSDVLDKDTEWTNSEQDEPVISDPAKVLPSMVTIYRGTGHDDKLGMAWSTDLHTGAWFARRFREDDKDHRLARTPGMGSPTLYRATVKRKDVLAYLVGRGESEVVVDPRKVIDPVRIPLPPVEETFKAKRFKPANDFTPTGGDLG